MINLFFRFNFFSHPLLAILSTVLAIQGFSNELRQESPPCYFSQPLLEVKTGYFFFSNSKMRKVYDEGGLDIQLCASYPLWRSISRWTLNAYCAIEYFNRSGKSSNGDEKASVWSVPINIGFKSLYAMNTSIRHYFSFGPRYLYIHQHNDSSYVYKNKSGNSLGFFVNTGFNYIVCGHFVIDIFGEYSYAEVRFHSGNSNIYTRNVQVGGFTFGGGLGYEF